MAQIHSTTEHKSFDLAGVSLSTGAGFQGSLAAFKRAVRELDLIPEKKLPQGALDPDRKKDQALLAAHAIAVETLRSTSPEEATRCFEKLL